MEIFLKCSSIAIFSSLLCVLLRKQSPEFSLLISITVSVLIIGACASLMDELKKFVDSTLDMLGASSTYVMPIIKCVGFGLISKLSANICREASQASVASALEYIGTVCALVVCTPIISTMLKMIGTLI